MSTLTKNLPRSASSQLGTRRAPLTSSTRKPRLSAKNRALLALLDSPEWSNPTSAQVKEQQDTMNFLMKSLDEDRIGYRRLYPKESEL